MEDRNQIEQFKRLAQAQMNNPNAWVGNAVTMTSAIPATYMTASAVQ